jgi:CheY-like chemotaxis protein/HPt (histidine-containing phosphotransfer) domain-containing protein
LPLGSAADTSDLARHGFFDFATKPLMQSELLNSLMNAVAAIQSGGAASHKILERHSAPPPSSPKSKHPGAKILLAEDNEINQEVAVEMLKRFGYECQVVNNGREAIESLCQGVYDLVLMDMQMPEMDGVEAARAIRQGVPGISPAVQRLPIIALTANAMKRDRDRCLEAGMNGYLSKPFDPLQLLETIEMHLEHYQRSGEAPAAAPAAVETESSAPARAPESAEPPVELEALLKRCLGDRSLAAQMIGKFQAKGAADVEQLSAAVAAGDVGEVARLAHRLKGVTGNLAMNPLNGVAVRLESMARDGHLDGAGENVIELQRQWRRFEEFAKEAAVT